MEQTRQARRNLKQTWQPVQCPSSPDNPIMILYNLPYPTPHQQTHTIPKIVMHDQYKKKITTHITFNNPLYIAKWNNISHISKFLSNRSWTTPKCTNTQITQTMKFKYAQHMGNTWARGPSLTFSIHALVGYYPTSSSIPTPRFTNAIMFHEFYLCHV
jgi:hypothetical protein